MRTIDGPPGAPTVLLLHGWTATADLNWFHCYEPLGEHYRVVGDTYGLATSVPAGLSADDLVALMGRDKKVLSSGLTFVLDGAAGVEVVPGVDPAVALLALGDMAAHR